MLCIRNEILKKSKKAETTKDTKVQEESNNACGLEGGVTNGQPILLRAAMKPISTLAHPLKSVDLSTGRIVDSRYERSDVCAVPAASVVGEAVVAPVIANAFLEKFGGDSLLETRRNFEGYREQVRNF